MRPLLLILLLSLSVSYAIGQAGIGITVPHASAMLDVTSTNKGFLPPRMTTAERNAIAAPAAGLTIFNTTVNCLQWYNGTYWYDACGTIAIGEYYKGGKIAYILKPGDPGYDANVPHGIIAAPSDQSIGAEWGCFGTPITGADGTALGTGSQNTMEIMAGCATTGIAARICGDLVLNGYSDWYLPSKDELNKLYENRVAVGGFAIDFYWSSTVADNYFAWIQYFGTGLQVNANKGDPYGVRAVRAF